MSEESKAALRQIARAVTENSYLNDLFFQTMQAVDELAEVDDPRVAEYLLWVARYAENSAAALGDRKAVEQRLFDIIGWSAFTAKKDASRLEREKDRKSTRLNSSH